jgi:ATP-dependent helicase/nuclease subunit A
MMQPTLDRATTTPLPDQTARDFALDPRNDVVLEASAGTGKTSVLVGRYVRLIDAGVAPRHILAITFTRKAAAEMRARVLGELARRAARRELSDPGVRVLREQAAEIHISTIDAFCFSLLREFPLEADVDPAFDIADETDVARFTTEAVEIALRTARGLVTHDERVRLLLARFRTPVLRTALGGLLDRRHVAVPAVAEFLRRRGAIDGAADAAAAFAARIRELTASRHRSALVDDGPLGSPAFHWLREDLVGLDGAGEIDAVRVHQLRRRLERYFLTRAGLPRRRLPADLGQEWFASPAARKRHDQAVQAAAPAILDAVRALQADVNTLLAHGLQRVLAIAVDQYERLLDEHALLDFAGLLDRAVRLLSRQEEFARSRLKLQSRFQHLLVDEFQDTSRLQWRLMELLVDAWGEGEGVADAPTSIFIVGDRKQSIYRFRHAEVTLLDRAAGKIAMLRPGRPVRQAIRASFRAVPELLAFVNALATAMQSAEQIDERFVFGPADAFPVPEVSAGAMRDGEPVLGLIAESSMPATAVAVAAEIERLLATAVVRDRHGPPRPARPDDVAVLFRARSGHQYFETALAARGIGSYVYKGLGFFDAPEVQDLQALVRYLARPDSDLCAAELLRSRIVRVSDESLARLAPDFARALSDPAFVVPALDELDARLIDAVRAAIPGWIASADAVSPSELVDRVLADVVYAFELRGPRQAQARENVKKLRGLIRRIESRGYATFGRLAAYFESLRTGEESHAVVEAAGCVNLMTIHAAKGLEFPIVFVANLHLSGKGAAQAISVIERGPDGHPEVAFGSSEATALEELREREELRRLMYVAATRARDRLYLAAQVGDDGTLERGARSLASLLPHTLASTFAAAAGAPPGSRVCWDASTASFAFRVCRAEERQDAVPASPAEAWVGGPPASLTIGRQRQRIVAATAADAPDHQLDPSAAASMARSDRLAGALVHRLFQRQIDAAADDSTLMDTVLALACHEELVDVADRRRLAAAVAATYRTMRGRRDVVELFASGICQYEVPFSFAPPETPGTVIRGVVDCVVLTSDGGAVVVEFKTGIPRPAHREQADLYRRAMASALEIDRVIVRILYP